MAPGTKFPEKAMGFMGCAMPAGRECDAVSPGMIAPPGEGMLAGITDMAGVVSALVTSVGPGPIDFA